MNPDAYMPYYGNDFEAACKAFRPETKWAYLCALWFYWHHTHCNGLPDDNDMLRRICEVDEASWARIRGSIFIGPPFFQLADGKWHQKRCSELYAETVSAYKSIVERSRLGVEAKKAKAESQKQPEVKPEAQPEVKPHVNQSESESESESDPKPEPSVTNKQSTLAPSLKQVKDKAQFIGLSEKDAEEFWHHFEAVGWIDKNGHQIIKWESKLATWKTSNQAKRFQDKQSAEPVGGLTAAQSVLYSKEYDRVCDALRRLNDGAASDAMGNKFFTQEDKAKRDKLTKRKAELKKLLNIVI